MKKKSSKAALRVAKEPEISFAHVRVFADTGFARKVGGRTIRLFLCCDGKDQPAAIFVDEATIPGKRVNCVACDGPHEVLSLVEAFRLEWLATDHERGGFCMQSHDLMVLELDALTENQAASAVAR
jgi:hypothetical protein